MSSTLILSEEVTKIIDDLRFHVADLREQKSSDGEMIAMLKTDEAKALDRCRCLEEEAKELRESLARANEHNACPRRCCIGSLSEAEKKLRLFSIEDAKARYPGAVVLTSDQIIVDEAGIPVSPTKLREIRGNVSSGAARLRALDSLPAAVSRSGKVKNKTYRHFELHHRTALDAELCKLEDQWPEVSWANHRWKARRLFQLHLRTGGTPRIRNVSRPEDGVNLSVGNVRYSEQQLAVSILQQNLTDDEEELGNEVAIDYEPEFAFDDEDQDDLTDSADDATDRTRQQQEQVAALHSQYKADCKYVERRVTLLMLTMTI